MTTIEMIKNLAQRNSVVASADVLAVFAELEASKKSNAFLKEQLAKLANFNPDWDMLEACRESWREVAAALKEAEGKLVAKDKHIAELEEDRRQLNLIINSEANRADAAEKRLATPVRLPTTSGRLGVAYTRVIPEVIEAIRAAGFKVMGDEQC
ncbi:hypothetical protein I5U18_15730 [Serratia ureilytica]|uniref:hypothetical protein n=1 Tax=Serratia ureilytica TaxID=300181 RepID=UPI0018D33EA5|nr:hypothetical protein [Serratia ureilytica]MBH1912024.1 hypothetical protein [Serratia ureilytica]